MKSRTSSVSLTVLLQHYEFRTQRKIKNTSFRTGGGLSISDRERENGLAEPQRHVQDAWKARESVSTASRTVTTLVNKTSEVNMAKAYNTPHSRPPGYEKSQRKHDVDAPCFLDSKEFKSLQLKVTGLVFQFSGEITAGQIVRYICGDMPKGRERQRFEGYIADAIETLVSARVIDRQGVLRVTYAKAEPYKAPEVIINNEKAKEYREHRRQYYASYATGGYELQERA